MSHIFFTVLELFMFAAAVSLDTFAASFAYGTGKIRIPATSAFIIAGICSGVLALSLIFASVLGSLLAENTAGIICFVILTVLGLLSLFDSFIKSFIRKKGVHKKITFSAFNLNFILNIYADPQMADSDLSKTLSAKEAIPLSVALSIDGLAVGFGAALVNLNNIEAVLLSFILNLFAVFTGGMLGSKLAKRTTLDLSWISGLVLLLLAVLNL